MGTGNRTMLPNKSLERACGHCGRAALAIDCVLAGAEWPSCLAAQLSR
jgi:hypothetical protein